MKQAVERKLVVTESATMVPDLLDLQAFCLVADLRSITAAAKTMNESKATVSRRVSRLEQALDVSLVKRTTRLVEPTDDGAAYRLKVGHVLELLADANDSARNAQSEPSGVLRVTSPPELSGTLAPTIVAFAERYPKVHVDMVVTQNIIDLDAEHIDVALRIAFQLKDSALIAHKLFDLEPTLAATPEYFKKNGGPPKRPDDLAKHRLVFLNHMAGRDLPFRNLKTNQITSIGPIRTYIGATDMNAVRELAIAGAGIAFIPRRVVMQDVALKKLQIAFEDYALEGSALYLLHHGGRFLPPKVRAFRDHVLTAFSVRGRTRTR